MKPFTAKLSQDVKTERPSVQSEYWDTGLGAVGCIFVSKSTGKILLSYRSSIVDEPHEWGTWGGKIDDGENKLQALAREIEEETGYTGNYKLFKLWTFEDPSEDFVYYNYLALVDDEFMPQRSAESERGKWVEWGEWPHPMHFGLEALLQNSGDEIHRVITLIKRKQADILEVMDTPPAIVQPASTNATANYNLTNTLIVAVTLYGEAGHEGRDGLQAVMNVIMNRAKGNFSKAKDIVLSPKQFSMWNSITNAPDYAMEFARLYARENTFREAINIVDFAQAGKLPDITSGATFYFNPKKANPSWAKKMVKTATIGNHEFYKPRKKVKKKMPVAIREMIETQDPHKAVLFKKGLAGEGIWEYELKSPKSYLRYRHEPDTRIFYLDNIGTPVAGDKNKGYAKALLETFFQLIKGQGGTLDSGPYTTSGTSYVKHVVERLSQQYGVRLVKGRDAIDEARFPAVKTKDGRVFVGRIHADAVSKTGDADLASVGWWDDGTYYPEEEARKKWGAAFTDTLEPELHRAWRLNRQVKGIGNDPVNELTKVSPSATVSEAYGDPGDHVIFGGVFYPERVVANVVNSHDSYFGHTRDHGPTRWVYYQGMKTVFWHKFPPAIPEWEIIVKDWLEHRGYEVERQTDHKNYYDLIAWYQKRGLLKEIEDSGVILGALDKNGSNLQPVYSADELANHPSYMETSDRRWRYYPDLEQLDWQGQPTPEEHEGTKEFLAQRGLMVKQVHYLAGSTKTAGK